MKNRLMMQMMSGGITDVRLREGEPGTDGTPPATTTPPPATTTPPTTTPSATATAGEPAGEPAGDGNIPVAVGETPATTTPGGAGESGQPAEINEEDYATKITLDETIAKDVEVDPGAMKTLAPLLKKANISVETAGELVNALAKYQVEQFKARQAERFADNKRMHDAALQKYSKVDFEQINAGIDAAFKRDGVMNFVIRNSEIGNDPEFLELMLWYGQRKPTDTQPAGSGGGGGTTGQSAGFSGISKAWN